MGFKYNYKMTKQKLHGYISISLILIALFIGGYAISLAKINLAFAYVLYVPVAFVIIAYFYCRKCCIKANCNHHFIGKIALLFKDKEKSKYTMSEILITALVLLLLVLAPQYWLFKSIPLFISFWILFAIAGIQVNRFVCVNCGNTLCAIRKELKNSPLEKASPAASLWRPKGVRGIEL